MRPRPKLLLVDDEPEILQSLGALLVLEVPSAEIVTAQDGLEALAVMEHEPIDLVVADYRMPQMNGLDLVARIHERWPLCATVLMTAYPDKDVAIDAINRGHVGHFMIKPIDSRLLAQVAIRLLGESRAARARAAHEGQGKRLGG